MLFLEAVFQQADMQPLFTEFFAKFQSQRADDLQEELVAFLRVFNRAEVAGETGEKNWRINPVPHINVVFIAVYPVKVFQFGNRDVMDINAVNLVFINGSIRRFGAADKKDAQNQGCDGG